jgi:hypothetical protein
LADTTFIAGGLIGARREFVVAGKPLHTLFRQIREVAERDLSVPAGDFLAIPILDLSRRTIDWYAHGEEAVVEPFTAVPEKEQARHALEILAIVQSYADLAKHYSSEPDPALQELGAALSLVADVPNIGDVYLVDGRPVAAYWGFRPDPDERRRSRARWAELAALAAPPPPPPPPPAAAPIETWAPRQRIVQWLHGSSAILRLEGFTTFWSLSALALLLFLGSLLAMLLSYSPAAARDDSALAKLRDDEASLNSQLDRLRLDIVRRRATCNAAPAPAPTPTPDAEQRAEDNNAGQGPLKIILTWNDPQDLDLHVTTPGCPKTLNYMNKHDGCGGQLDIDRNVGGKIEQFPIEHSFWIAPRPGAYRIVVKRVDNGQRKRPVRFTVTAIVNGRRLPPFEREFVSTPVDVGSVSYP